MTELDETLSICSASLCRCALSDRSGGRPIRGGVPIRPSLGGGSGMSGLTPAPTMRVHDPSGVATHGVALGSAGQSAFRSARVVMALLVPCLCGSPWPNTPNGLTYSASAVQSMLGE
jgi:hypothetical protein